MYIAYVGENLIEKWLNRLRAIKKTPESKRNKRQNGQVENVTFMHLDNKDLNTKPLDEQIREVWHQAEAFADWIDDDSHNATEQGVCRMSYLETLRSGRTRNLQTPTATAISAISAIQPIKTETYSCEGVATIRYFSGEKQENSKKIAGSSSTIADSAIPEKSVNKGFPVERSGNSDNSGGWRPPQAPRTLDEEISELSHQADALADWILDTCPLPGTKWFKANGEQAEDPA